MRKTIASLTLALMLAGCGAAPLAPYAGSPSSSIEAQAKAKSKLPTQIKSAFRATFKRLDKDKDGAFTPKDFDLEEKNFLNLFGKQDANNDSKVTWAEYMTPKRLDTLIEHCDAKSHVAQRAYGRISEAKAVEALDLYFGIWVNKRDRKGYIKKCFTKADANKDKVLNLDEFAHAIALVEALTDEKYIEKRVNRSSGQTAEPEPAALADEPDEPDAL